MSVTEARLTSHKRGALKVLWKVVVAIQTVNPVIPEQGDSGQRRSPLRFWEQPPIEHRPRGPPR